jgi:hypothetical protein
MKTETTYYYQGIAAFEAHDIGTSLGKAEEQLVNFLLHYVNGPTELGTKIGT